MRHLALALSLSSVLVASCAASRRSVATDPTVEELTEAWMRAATPGAEHRALDAFVGTWNATLTYWMAPDAPPEVSKGTMVNEWILDGHHLVQHFHGEMAGMPFEGVGTWGFDVAAGEYYGTWQDSMSTSLMVSRGPRSKDGKVFEMVGTNTNPITGEPAQSDEIITIDSRNRHTMQMFETRGLQRVKTMEIVYDRAF